MNIPQPPSLPLLNDDLITEILSWLPVKSILRFRCVCKSWKSLFSNSTFVKLHLQRSPKHSNILLYYDSFHHDDYKPYAFSCSASSLFQNASLAKTKHDYTLQLKRSYCVVGSCNGLVCLRKINFLNDEINEYWVRFWNPAMGLRSKKSPCLRGRLRMVNEISSSAARFGFGYDDSSDCYKVVAVMLDSEKMKVKVHCMGDTCWRMIGTLPSFPILSQIDGKFVNGTINWVALQGSGFKYQWGNVNVKKLVIFSFHLEKNMFKHVPFPEGINELPVMEPQLAVLRDCLCLFLDYYKGSQFRLWQMKEFGVQKSWTPIVHLENAGYVIPVCLSDNGNLVLLSNSQYDRAVLHNQRDNNRVVHVQETHSQFWMNAMEHVQSMVLPP